jgi:hypothetical protein
MNSCPEIAITSVIPCVKSLKCRNFQVLSTSYCLVRKQNYLVISCLYRLLKSKLPFSTETESCFFYKKIKLHYNSRLMDDVQVGSIALQMRVMLL